jgi:hypothetical protein
MAKLLPPLAVLQLFDDLGGVLAGGKVHSFAAGTTTPKTTWTDSTGATPNANPVILDSAGRAEIWLTEGEAYKFVIRDASDVTLETVDNVSTGEAEAAEDDEYDLIVTYAGTPGAQGWIGGIAFARPVTFPVDLVGSRGSVVTAPASSYVIDVKKNGTTVATITIGTDGVFAFATTGGATIACASGDTLDFYGPDTIGTAADIKITIVGDLP